MHFIVGMTARIPASFAALILGVAAASTGCSKRAEAQEAPDPMGPVRCYQAMGTRFATQTIRQLCAGAPSDAPARCVNAAVSANQLSDSQAISLCLGATDTSPAECAARAAADGKLTNDTIVNSCSPRGGAARPDVAACVDAGRAELRLSDSELLELCAPGASVQNNFRY